VHVRTPGIANGKGLAGIVGVCVMACCAALAGCSSSQAPAASGASPASSGKAKITVAMVTAQTTDPFWTTQACAAQVAASKYNVSFSYQGTTSPEFQQELTTLNAVIQKHPDAIVLVPYSPTAFVAPIEKAISSGIKVIVDGAPLSSKVGSREYLSNNFLLGEDAAKGLAKEIGGKGDVAIESFVPDIPTTDDRVLGFEAAIKKFPGIKLVAVNWTNDISATVTQDVSAVLQAHPNLAGIFATDGDNAQATASSLKAAGDSGKVKLIAFDATPDEVAGLKSGVYQGLIAQDPYDYGYDSVQYAAEVVRNQVHPTSGSYEVLLPGVFIDNSNVNSPAVKKYEYTSSCS
jgi:ribose transport system substrate-binding protein